MAFRDSFRRNRPRVKGLDLPGPRLTAWAWGYFALYVAVPVLAATAILDLALYLFFDQVVETCYGVLCLFE